MKTLMDPNLFRQFFSFFDNAQQWIFQPVIFTALTCMTLINPIKLIMSHFSFKPVTKNLDIRDFFDTEKDFLP